MKTREERFNFKTKKWERFNELTGEWETNWFVAPKPTVKRKTSVVLDELGRRVD